MSDCYIYGPGTRNIRIESLWRQQPFTTTITWIGYFKSLQEAIPLLYRQHDPADQIVFISLCLSCGMNLSHLSVPTMLIGSGHSLNDHTTSSAYQMSYIEQGNSMGLHPTIRCFRP